MTLTTEQDGVLEGLAHHRYLTPSLVRRLWLPDTTPESGAANKILGYLADKKMAGSVRNANGRGEFVWWATETGHKYLAARSGRAYRATAEKAAGQGQAHSILVSEVAVLFTETARSRGDDCGPFSLAHEVCLSTDKDPVIADGLLSYMVADPLAAVEALIEVDRAKYSPRRLWERLRAYAALWGEPERHALKFMGGWPPVLVLVAGETPRATALRIDAALGFLEHDDDLAQCEMRIGFASMDDLRRWGPWAPIFALPRVSDKTDWTLQAVMAQNDR
jgi:hypothetical protein